MTSDPDLPDPTEAAPTETDAGIDHKDVLSPGSTATGAGTTELGDTELGTTEADVSDGREQKQPRVD
jgi:hypothetical protein